MKFTTITNISALLFSLLFLFVQASPVPEPLDKRDVFVPPILYPHAGTVWRSGEQHSVVWDVSNPPAQITNTKGMVLLRKGNLSTPLVLAAGFDILLGRITIQVPLVLEDDDYSLVLFGDSGNFSPQFTILSGIP